MLSGVVLLARARMGSLLLQACRVQVCRCVKKGSLCVQAEYGRPAPAFFCRLLLPAQEQPFFGKQQPSSHQMPTNQDQLPASVR